MSTKLGRVLVTIISVIVVLAIVLGAVGVFLVRSSFPRTNGEVKAERFEYSC